MDRNDKKRDALLMGVLSAAVTLATAEKAKALAEQLKQVDLAARNDALLEIYRSGQPARDNP